jgi:GNAT superfamily N-acetyltransferase
MYNIKEENTLAVAKEIIKLGKKHYDEVEDKSSVIPYDVDLYSIDQILKAGLFSIVTCRLEGELVGYYVSLLAPDFMTREQTSKEVAIYVAKDHRRQGIYNQLRDAAEAIARSRGCASIIAIFKTGHNDTIPLTDGYQETERVYQKILKD